MAAPRRTLILVNSSQASGLGERAQWISLAAGKAEVVYREGRRASAIRYFVRRIWDFRPNVVYLVDCAIATVVAGALARCILGGAVILDTGDAVAALTSSTGRGGRLGSMLAGAIERLGYRIASVVVVRSDGLAEHVRRLADRASVVIPDGFDPTVGGLRTGAGYRSAWKAGESDLVIGVVGSANWNSRLSWCYGRDVIEVLARTKRKDIIGVVVARGNGILHLNVLASQLGVSERLVFDEPADGDAFWEQLGAIDIALSTQTNDAVGRARTTGKLVQYIAAGKFVLASRVGAAARILPEEMLVDYHGAWDPEYFSRLASRVENLPDRYEVRRRGACLIDIAQAFSYKHLVDRLQHEVFGLLP